MKSFHTSVFAHPSLLSSLPTFWPTLEHAGLLHDQQLKRQQPGSQEPHPVTTARLSSDWAIATLFQSLNFDVTFWKSPIRFK